MTNSGPQRYAIGADIGGTHITSALVDLNSKTLLEGSLTHQPVDSAGLPKEILPAWTATIRQSMQLVAAPEIAGIGIAMPGPFDYENGISWIRGTAKFDHLYGMNIKKALAASLDLPTESIAFMNDANCFLFGESWVTEQEYHSVIGITLGTGFGAAFYKDRQMVSTGKGVPPDAEFFPIPYLDGMSEDYISARGIIKDYHQRGGEPVTGVKTIAERAMEKEAKALAAFEDFGTKLGDFLGYWLREFEAEALIIGGNISRSADLFLPAFYEALQKQQTRVKVIQSRLLDKAGILGAARQFERP